MGSGKGPDTAPPAADAVVREPPFGCRKTTPKDPLGGRSGSGPKGVKKAV